MCNKKRCKNKRYICKCCLQCFSSENFLMEHKGNCLIINGKQSIKLRNTSISCKNLFKQLPVPFKIYADFECILKKVKSSHKNNDSHTERYQDHIPCSFAYKVVCINNKFTKRVVFYRGKSTVYRFIEAILNQYDYCKENDK